MNLWIVPAWSLKNKEVFRIVLVDGRRVLFRIGPGFIICKNLGVPRCVVHVAASFCLVSPLEDRKKKKMPKGCLMVMTDPLDSGHGKNYLTS